MNGLSNLPLHIFFTATLILVCVLARLVVIDLRTRRLPDRYTLPLILMGLAINAYGVEALPTLAVWGAITGYVVFWAIGAVYFRVRGFDGLGLGDAKLLSAAGAWLGVTALPMVILVSAGGALIYALAGGLRARDNLAFGPWLAAAFFLLWVKEYVSP